MRPNASHERHIGSCRRRLRRRAPVVARPRPARSDLSLTLPPPTCPLRPVPYTDAAPHHQPAIAGKSSNVSGGAAGKAARGGDTAGTNNAWEAKNAERASKNADKAARDEAKKAKDQKATKKLEREAKKAAREAKKASAGK